MLCILGLECLTEEPVNCEKFIATFMKFMLKHLKWWNGWNIGGTIYQRTHTMYINEASMDDFSIVNNLMLASNWWKNLWDKRLSLFSHNFQELFSMKLTDCINYQKLCSCWVQEMHKTKQFGSALTFSSNSVRTVWFLIPHHWW